MRNLTYLLIIFAANAFAQPANDDCSNATTLTIDNAISCSQTTQSASLQGSECYVNYSFNTETTVWYRITADNDSLVINFVQTNTSDCRPTMNIFGPFTAGAGCLPGCGTNIYSSQFSGDLGSHILLVGWTPGSDYLIQIQNNNCGGPSANYAEYCIGVASPAKNATSTGASLIDECGTTFSETTDGGYWNSGTGTGFANLDNNAATSCSTCGPGLDVPYVINNAAWNTFCSLADGTWSVTVDNVSNCALTGAGVQASLFTGTTAALVNEDNVSPVPGTGWTSSTITVNNGDCAYLVIDGFAGDICDYDVTLTNISGTCDVLPLELTEFEGTTETDGATLWWEIASASEISSYILEYSSDGENFQEIAEISSIGDHDVKHTYDYFDKRRLGNHNYYRLSSVSTNGEQEVLAIKYFKRAYLEDVMELQVFPNPATDNLRIQAEHHGATEMAELLIYAMDGNVVHSQKTELMDGLNEIELDIQQYEPGKYYVQLIESNSVRTVSFIAAN